MKGIVEFCKFPLLAVPLAVGFGVTFDQVTIRVCPEYFTVAHPYVAHSSLTELALKWGVMATWWVGMPLGLAFGVVCRAGSWPKLTAGSRIKPALLLILAMYALCALAGLGGYVMGGIYAPVGALEGATLEQRNAFGAAAFAHQMAYASGGIGGVLLMALSLVKRAKLAAQAPPSLRLEPISENAR